jgi:hypothetical protein
MIFVYALRLDLIYICNVGSSRWFFEKSLSYTTHSYSLQRYSSTNCPHHTTLFAW